MLHYKGLLRSDIGYYAKYKTCFDSSNHYNVIFLGSSRAEMHYNTWLFDSLTDLNSFNLSMAGASPQVAYSLLKIYLAKSKPPILLFYEVDLHNLKDNATGIYNFNNFFPFLRNPLVREEFNLIDSRMKHFYYNPYFSFAYTGIENLNTSVHNWLRIPVKTDPFYYKGYFRDTLHSNLNYQKTEPELGYMAENRKNYLDSIINLCKRFKININLISSPIFAGGQLDLLNKKQLINQLSNFAEMHGIFYSDLTSLPFCNQRKLFSDHHHLNAEGSRIFTEYLVHFFSNKSSKVSLNYLN